MDITYIIVAAFITGVIARWLSLLFRSQNNSNLRNVAFFVIWFILFALSFLGAN
jgi:hypothetical protein